MNVFWKRNKLKDDDICVNCDGPDHKFIHHDALTKFCMWRGCRCMGFVRKTKRNQTTTMNLLIFISLMACVVCPLLAVIVDDSVQDSTTPVSYTIPLKAVTDLDIGWPSVAHLSWSKGYLEFHGNQPTKAAREFFNVYLKDLVDSYIADQLGHNPPKKKKERTK